VIYLIIKLVCWCVSKFLAVSIALAPPSNADSQTIALVVAFPASELLLSHRSFIASTQIVPPHHLKQQCQILPAERMFMMTEITQPCVHMCDSLFFCQLYLLPELLEEMDSKEDTPLTLPFALFVSLSQLIIVI
jgi:hypothetical protein